MTALAEAGSSSSTREIDAEIGPLAAMRLAPDKAQRKPVAAISRAEFGGASMVHQSLGSGYGNPGVPNRNSRMICSLTCTTTTRGLTSIGAGESNGNWGGSSIRTSGLTKPWLRTLPSISLSVTWVVGIGQRGRSLTQIFPSHAVGTARPPPGKLRNA